MWVHTINSHTTTAILGSNLVRGITVTADRTMIPVTETCTTTPLTPRLTLTSGSLSIIRITDMTTMPTTLSAPSIPVIFLIEDW